MQRLGCGDNVVVQKSGGDMAAAGERLAQWRSLSRLPELL